MSNTSSGDKSAPVGAPSNPGHGSEQSAEQIDRDLRAALDQLAQEVFQMAAGDGTLPDGDTPNTATAMWAEQWAKRLTPNATLNGASCDHTKPLGAAERPFE